MRVFFATDIHGSETCWRKFLNSAKYYEADVIVLGGDMTGKALVPIVEDGGGRWHATLLEIRHDLNGEDEIAAFILPWWEVRGTDGTSSTLSQLVVAGSTGYVSLKRGSAV